jgi:amino acid transporter
MATAEQAIGPIEEQADKGLKGGALSLVSSVVIATASVAPAYSLAATLGFVVAAIGLQSPIVCIAAFVPMLLCSIGYNELNKADPDCGTTFTWGTRAFGPKTGWAGGWGIVAADILVMASLAQVAGQYVFLLFGADGIGTNQASSFVLLVGVLWIIAMTYICYRGIEVSANFQKALLGIELTMLTVLSVTALVKVYTGHGTPGSVHIAASWFNPLDAHFSAFIVGLVLFIFIYWGWDTAVSVNEETADKSKIPGRSAIISTLLLLVIYLIATTGAQAYAGIGTSGVGLANSANSSDVLSILGGSIFGAHGFGLVLWRLLILMVLSSAAASTQTTILPTARTTLSMAVYKALPQSFAKMHPRYLTPTVSTVIMGLISIALYVPMNYLSHGKVIVDAVTACGIWIAFYYGLTAISCVWYYRANLTSSARNLWMQGILPGLGAVILFGAGGYSLWEDWDVATGTSDTSFTLPGLDWHIGGVFVIAFLSALAGFLFFIYLRIVQPDFFRGRVLNRATATLVPDEAGAGQISTD